MPRQRLDASSAGLFLARHGVISSHDRVHSEPLGGGVSSQVIMAQTETGRFVLKQPLPEFSTEAEWVVDTGRGRVEHTFGIFLERHLGRDSLAPMLAYDESDEVIIMEATPVETAVWKRRLLQGHVSVRSAAEAGRLLGRLHDLVERLGPQRFRHDDLFYQQRTAPYFEEVARRRPEWKDAVEETIRLFHARNDLVHGDFSPKNLFVDPRTHLMRVIDHEVVTRGDAAFDLAFVCNHLLLKSIHMPHLAAALRAAMRALVAGYHDARTVVVEPPKDAEARAARRYLPPLLLARVIGRSPVEYLDDRGRQQAERLALRSFEAEPADMDDVLRLAARVRSSP